MESLVVEQKSVRVAVVDTETTGLAAYDEPISVGVILLEVCLPKGEIISELARYYGLRCPGVPINPRAQAVHGISFQSLAGLEFDYDRVCEIFNQADFVIAHNAEFDKRMLEKVINDISHKNWLCSVKDIYWIDFIKVGDRKLDTLCRHFEIARQAPHNALSDASALMSVLVNRSGTTKRSRTFLGHAIMRAKPIFPGSVLVTKKDTTPASDMLLESAEQATREARARSWVVHKPKQRKKTQVSPIIVAIVLVIAFLFGLLTKK